MADANSITGEDRKVNAVLTETEADMKANNNATLDEAKAATEKEHKMTLMEGLRLYPKAVAWSLLISTCIAMEGFDLALVNGLYGFAPWRQKYGELQPDGGYEVSAAWQAGLSNGANVGSIIGLFINGWISERFGYRYTIISCLVLLMGFTTIFFTAQNVETLLVAEILCGIPVSVPRVFSRRCNADICNSGVSSRLSPSPMLQKSVQSLSEDTSPLT
jgi:SP family general alpha glucoside:H+ symporter-like MFS transporter